MAENKIEGLGVALVTPFSTDLSIDFNGLERVLQHVIDGGVDYIVVLGTTAETPTLSKIERIKVIDFVREKVSGRLPLVIGVGGNCTNGVLEDIQSLNLDGYSAILSVAPYYNKPTQSGLYQHFREISKASKLPVILYNVPGRTGVNISADTTIKLSQDCLNIYGIKEASGNTEQWNNIHEKSRTGFNLISGDDAATIQMMKIGASGVISVLANACPAQVKKVVNLCHKNRFDEALESHDLLKNLISSLFEEGNPAGVKAILSEMGLIQNKLRLPLTPVSDGLYNKIKKEVSLL